MDKFFANNPVLNAYIEFIFTFREININIYDFYTRFKSLNSIFNLITQIFCCTNKSPLTREPISNRKGLSPNCVITRFLTDCLIAFSFDTELKSSVLGFIEKEIAKSLYPLDKNCSDRNLYLATLSDLYQCSCLFIGSTGGLYFRYSQKVIFISFSVIPQCFAASGRFILAWKSPVLDSSTSLGVVFTLSSLTTILFLGIIPRCCCILSVFR